LQRWRYQARADGRQAGPMTIDTWADRFSLLYIPMEKTPVIKSRFLCKIFISFIV
jgi:hypothetical protein